MAEVVVILLVVRISCFFRCSKPRNNISFIILTPISSQILPFSLMYLYTDVIYCRVDGHIMDLSWYMERMSMVESFRSTGSRSLINAQFNSLLEHGLEIAP
jgi:hypothetical protein